MLDNQTGILQNTGLKEIIILDDGQLSQHANGQVRAAYQLLSEMSFCVMDLETTGGDHLYDKIIEIGLIKVERLRVVDELTFLVDPKIPIPEFVQKLTSIYPKDLENAPPIEEVVDRIVKFIGDSVLVAHNSSFDIPFFNSVLQRLNRVPLDNPTICTNLMTKFLIPEIMNSNLTYVGELFGIDHCLAHRALEDARATARLLMCYLHFFIGRKIKKINHLYYPRKKYEFDTLHFHANEDSFDTLLEKVAIIKGPMLLTVKGKKGAILAQIPLTQEFLQQNLNYLKSKVHQWNWDTLSLKMMGHFFKCLLTMNTHFHYLSHKAQEQSLQFIEERYFESEDNILSELASKNISVLTPFICRNKGNLTENFASLKRSLFDTYFLIAPHLIKEHYSTFCLNGLSSTRSELIFRFPAHQKRLWNFINGHIRSMKERKKIKKDVVPPLRPYFENHLLKSLVTDTPYLLFSGSLVSMGAKRFRSILLEYLAKSPHLYDYPKEHI